MTELSDIILKKKKVEDKKEKNNEMKQRKKTYTIEEELKDWEKHLKEKLFNRYYKKVIKEIVSSSLISKFKKVPGGYKIIILYIQAHIKVIENKIFKYHLNPNDIQKQKYQINHCFQYANNVQEELNLLLQEISETNLYDNIYYYDIEKRNYKIELFDNIIRCHFDYIYIMSLLHYQIGDFMESISYLGLFVTLYKETIPYILSTHTLYKIEKCFILLSKIYITNEDFENALKILYEAIKVCFKQILFQVHEIYYGVFIGEKKDLVIREREDLLILNDKRIKRIILNIVIIFLYQGICNEHLSKIKNATAFYKQCEWFSRIFLLKNNSLIYKLFFRLKKTAIEVCNNIDFMSEKIDEYEMKMWKKKRDEINNGLNNKKYMKKEKLYDTTKYKGLIKILHGLKIQEIDTVNKFENNKNIKCLSSRNREGEDKNLFLSNIRLLEAYLRNDFKNIINNMEKIKMFDLDYRTRTIVQKTINKIYFENNQKFIRLKNKTSLYKPQQKSLTIKNKSVINGEDINKTNSGKKTKNESNKNYKKFDFGSYLAKKQNKKLKLNLMKPTLSKSNSLNSFSIQKGKIDDNPNEENTLKTKILFRNQKPIISRQNKKINYSSSNSLLLNSTNIPLNQNTTRELQSKSLLLIDEKLSQKNKDKEKSPKNKSVITTKIYKSTKYKVFHPENQKLSDFFNFKYLKKREFIKKLCDRELIFQKLILKSKNSPRPPFQLFNKNKVEQNADNAYSKIESLVTNRVTNTFWKDYLSEEEYKEFIINDKLEKILCGSLDNRALLSYKMNKKNREKKEKEEIMEDGSKKFENIENNNKIILDELNSKLNEIYINELKRKKRDSRQKKDINEPVFKKLYRNRSALNRLNIKDKLNNKFERSKSFLNSSNNVNKSHFN